MNISEIKIMLNSDAARLCYFLLPNGKERHGNFTVGSIAGEEGKSLVVDLRKGVWKDFANPEDKGDLIDLWRRVNNVDLQEALTQIRDWLGIKQPNLSSTYAKRRKAIEPDKSGLQRIVSGGPVFRYLNETRGIPSKTIFDFLLRQIDDPRHGPSICFPLIDPATKKATCLKFMAVRRKDDGGKIVWSSRDSVDHLFGLSNVDLESRILCLTEGEIDALTLSGLGFPAASIPRGVCGLSWIEEDFDHLDRFEKIYLFFDSDEAGQSGAIEVARRLGQSRCYNVSMPEGFKDVNEFYLDGRTEEDFQILLEEAKTLDPPSLNDSDNDAYWKGTSDLFFSKRIELQGTDSPWPIPWKIRNGELTIWTGFSGHGKSLALSQVLLHDIHQEQITCVASFEIPIKKQLEIFCRQALARAPESTDEINQVRKWLAGRLFFYDKTGFIDHKEMLETFCYAHNRYGCTRFAIDSFLFCGAGPDDYSKQKQIIGNIRDFVDKKNVHCHLVAHSRKKEDEAKTPGKLDVKGGSDITDIANNGLSIWRNKKKEQNLHLLEQENTDPFKILEERKKPDGCLQFWKQRETGDEPFRTMLFDKDAMQFCTIINGKKEDLRRYIY